GRRHTSWPRDWSSDVCSSDLTLRLQQQGLLPPYDSPSARPYPAETKAEDHTWHAFAARARVLIVNTDLVPEAERPRSLLDLTGRSEERRVGKEGKARRRTGPS